LFGITAIKAAAVLKATSLIFNISFTKISKSLTPKVLPFFQVADSFDKQ